MKKKLSIILAASMAFTLLSTAAAFADTAAAQGDSATGTGSAVSASTSTTAGPVSVTLEEALAKMDSSVQMQLIEIQNMGDKAVAAGSTEGLNAIQKA